MESFYDINQGQLGQADLLDLLAEDELVVYESLEYAEEFAAFFEAFRQRRAALSELESRRVQRLRWNHKAIQAIFDRAGIALQTEDSTLS